MFAFTHRTYKGKLYYSRKRNENIKKEGKAHKSNALPSFLY